MGRQKRRRQVLIGVLKKGKGKCTYSVNRIFPTSIMSSLGVPEIPRHEYDLNRLGHGDTDKNSASLKQHTHRIVNQEIHCRHQKNNSYPLND